jgi:hypothetical protein
LTVGHFLSGRGVQHRPQVPQHLQEFVPRRDDDLLDEPAKRLARCIAMVVVFQTGGQHGRLLAEYLGHVGCNAGSCGPVKALVNVAFRSSSVSSSAFQASER